MEDRLKETGGSEADVKIALTTMAYRNAEIIKLLRERGKYIKFEQWDK